MTQAFWEQVGAPAWVKEQDALDRQLVAHDRALLAAAALADGDRVVDAGCGAGALTLKVAQAVAPTGSVIGVDFSQQMLRLAERRASEADLPVTFVEADLTAWDGKAQAFTSVVSRLGLTDSLDMLATLRGVLRSGGRLVATVFRDVGENEWMLLPTMAVAGVLPVELPPPGRGGPFALADAGHTTTLLTEAGFTDVHLDALDYEVRMTGPKGGGVDVVLAVGPAAAALAAADDAGRAAARCAVDEVLAPYDDGAGAVLKASAWVISAKA